MRATPSPGSGGSDLLEDRTFAQSERETRLTLAAVTLVGLQGYLEGLDDELFTHVTRAALRAAALRAEACPPKAPLPEPTPPVGTGQGLAKTVEPDCPSVRGTLAP